MDPEAASTEAKMAKGITIDMPSLPDDKHGYHLLASLMACSPELAFFRRFATLNLKNILYLQAELVVLERELRDAARKDEQSGNEMRQYYSRAWAYLCHADESSGGSPQQWEVFSRVRKTLQEYSLLIIPPFRSIGDEADFKRCYDSPTKRTCQDA